MEENVEDFMAEDLFGDHEDNVADQNNENSIPNEEALNELFKEGDKTQVKPKRKGVSRPQPKLGERELCGDKGIVALKRLFDGYKPDARKDPYGNMLDMMNKMEYWAHLLHPKAKFEDFIERVEKVGEKRMVKTYMEKMRLGMPLTDDDLASTSQNEAPLIGADDDGVAKEPSETDMDTQHRDEGLNDGTKTLKPNDHLDEFVDHFYNAPESMQVNETSQQTSSQAPGLSQQQRERIAESKRRADDLRKKRDAFLNRIDASKAGTPDDGTADRNDWRTDSVQKPVPMPDSDGDPGPSTATDMMDDAAALDFVFSSD